MHIKFQSTLKKLKWWPLHQRKINLKEIWRLVKDYTIQQKLSIISEWKLLEILGGNDNLMIFLLHGIEPMLFSLK